MAFQPYISQPKKKKPLRDGIHKAAGHCFPTKSDSCTGGKRTSCRALPGSLTAEAAIVLPLFLFAVVNLLSLLLLFRQFSVQAGQLHQTGRALSLLAHGQKDGEADIRLVQTLRVKPLIPVAGFPAATVANGCVMHKWIGFALGEETGNGAASNREELVFITDFGEAWHRDRGCGYLNPRIDLMSLEEAKTAKNSQGRPYAACQICHPADRLVYVTQGGERYHGTVTCSGLRRTIRSVTLEKAQAAGRHACPECGG